MAKLGSDFAIRWQQTPLYIRETILNELHNISEMLHPRTDLQDWLAKHDQVNVTDAFIHNMEEFSQKLQLTLDIKIEEKLATFKTELSEWAKAMIAEELSQISLKQLQGFTPYPNQ